MNGVGIRATQDRSAWTELEKQLFKLLLQKFGIGQWKQIIDSTLLPGKLNAQMVGMTQRLLGAQSLARYSGLRLDIDRIKYDNDRKKAHRKAKMIINSNALVVKDELQQQRSEVQEKYGLTAEQLEDVDSEISQLKALQHSARTNGHLLEIISRSEKCSDRSSKIQLLQESLCAVECLLDTVSWFVLPRAQNCAGQPSTAPGLTATVQPYGSAANDEMYESGIQKFQASAGCQQAGGQRKRLATSGQQKQKRRKQSKPKQRGADAGGIKLVNQYVQQLQDMGFSRRMAQDALAEVDYDIDAAAVWLLQNVQT